MQSTISHNDFSSPYSIGRVLPIIFDVLLIVDLFLSIFYFFFNPNRTYSLGIYFILALQVVFFPFFILIAFLQSKWLISDVDDSIAEKSNTVKKHPLAHTLQKGNRETEIVRPRHESKLNLLQNLIFLGFTLNVVITINFILLGVYMNRVGYDGNLAILNLMLDQVFYLPPVFFMIFYYYYLKGQGNVSAEIEVIKGGTEQSPVAKTFLTRLKMRKGFRLIIFLSLIMLIITVGVFFYANDMEDNNISSLDLNKTGSYKNVRILGMYDKGDEIDVIAFGTLAMPGVPLTNQLLKFSIDTENNEIINIEELPNISSGVSNVIDSVVTDNEMYLQVLDNIEWQYLVYRYSFETEQTEQLFTWRFNLTGVDFRGSQALEYRFTYGQFQYILSAYEDGVHLIQTQIPNVSRPHMANIISIDSMGISVRTLNLTVLDVITRNNNTYLLHISESGFENFDLTIFNHIGANFSDGSKITKTIPSTFSEDIYGLPTPNSATFFVVENTLYYRSTQNLFDIDNMEPSNESPNIANEDYNFYSRGLRGVVYQNNLVFMSTEEQIQYTAISDLKVIENAVAKNADYSSSILSNILISDDKLVTASDNGRIFIWEVDPELIQQDKDRFSELIFLAIIVYVSSSSIYFIVRRKI